MPKVLLQQVDPYVRLYRDDRTGIAWVENGHTGLRHSAHPNIDASGSVRGMKSLGYWARDAKTVRSHGFIYNISQLAYNADDPLDMLALQNCRCGGVHG